MAANVKQGLWSWLELGTQGKKGWSSDRTEFKLGKFVERPTASRQWKRITLIGLCQSFLNTPQWLGIQCALVRKTVFPQLLLVSPVHKVAQNWVFLPIWTKFHSISWPMSSSLPNRNSSRPISPDSCIEKTLSAPLLVAIGVFSRFLLRVEGVGIPCVCSICSWTISVHLKRPFIQQSVPIPLIKLSSVIRRCPAIAAIESDVNGIGSTFYLQLENSWLLRRCRLNFCLLQKVLYHCSQEGLLDCFSLNFVQLFSQFSLKFWK